MDLEWQHLLIFCTQSLDEHDHMMFVLHHLNDILELLMEPGIMFVLCFLNCHMWRAYNARHGQWYCYSSLFLSESSANNGCGSEACLTIDALDALGFLITGSTDNRSEKMLLDVLWFHSYPVLQLFSFFPI